VKILLFGKNGQLGRELQPRLSALGSLTALDSAELDLVDLELLRKTIRALRPHLIVNASGYTAVDRAEQEAALAMTVNASAPGVMAELARELDAGLLHFSTDYVFDGEKGSAYVATDEPGPLSAYGRSKLEGERLVQAAGGTHLILRTAWLYGRGGDNFVTKVLRWARERETLRVAEDQIGSPTSAAALADITAQVIMRGHDHLRSHTGLYHLAGEGMASRFEWAEAIVRADPNRAEHRLKRIIPALADEFPLPARRPKHSALDCSLFASTFGLSLPPWRLGLERALRIRAEDT